MGLLDMELRNGMNLAKRKGYGILPLNKIGKQQASALANRLSLNLEWDLIVTSDLSRAIETAQIISSKLKLSVSIRDERIREINCGEIEGTTEVERIIKWGSNWRELNLGMEKFEGVSSRGLNF